MKEYALILVSTILVNNFVLVKFLGLCPFMGVSRKLETATGMALATTFVLTLSSVLSYLVSEYLLVPFGLEYLDIIAFILVIAGVVQLTEMIVHKVSPLLYQVLGIFYRSSPRTARCWVWRYSTFKKKTPSLNHSFTASVPR